jgi:hypothetical protein
MELLPRQVSAAAVSGTMVSVATTATLMLLAKAAGKAAVQPTNATSHWLHGETAGGVERMDVPHTLVGYATHHASAIFWALIFEAWLTSRPPRRPARLLAEASIMTAIAATVDYGITPKRLTPGWEEVLPKRSILGTFAVMAVALAAGSMLGQRLRNSH